MNGPAFEQNRGGGGPRRVAFTAWLVPSVLSVSFLVSAVSQSGAHISSAKDLLEEGETLVRQGRLAEAEAVMDRAETLSPTDVDVLTLLGKIKGRLGQYPEAVTLFQRVIHLSPKSAEAHINLAIALSDAGALPKALEETSKALAIDPNLATAHLNRGRILDDLHREPEAAAEFAAARRLNPNDFDVYYYWSFVEHAEGNLAKESTLLQRAVKLQPRNDRALIRLASCFLHQSRKSEAVVALRRALAINPKSSDAIYMLSRALFSSDPEESARLREKLETLKAESAALDRSKVLANEGYGAFMEQDWPKAIRLFKEALETCGACEIQATLHKNLGLALCRSGNVDAGGDELRRALALNPNDTDVAKALSVISQ